MEHDFLRHFDQQTKDEEEKNKNVLTEHDFLRHFDPTIGR